MLALVTFVSGCAIVPFAPEVTSSPQSNQSDILTRELPPEITAYGVVLAALYLATGDVGQAIENGKISPAEVSEAKTAIRENTLDLWRQRAELELGG